MASLGELTALDRTSIDLGDADAIRKVVRDVRPNVLVNAAAYTAVDRAESERDLAMRINGEAPGVMAEEAKRAGALMIHYSTDYVFDGQASRPYIETDQPNPVTAYGASKLEGDERVLQSGADAYIFRVAWVYASRGQNFLRTIRRLAAERDELRIVADQQGSPTWARLIAETTAVAVSRWLSDRTAGRAPPTGGSYHMAAPDHATWFEFASSIIASLPEEARRPSVTPIATRDYPTPARRPAWSVLDSRRLDAAFGLRLPSWKTQLSMCLEEA
jgi:dTDP-4-dehydrorhamnose reductase